jgi:hypothetical protein
VACVEAKPAPETLTNSCGPPERPTFAAYLYCGGDRSAAEDLLQDVQQDHDAGRAFAVILDRDGRVGTVVAGQPVNPRAPVPVIVRLPDFSGVVVAAYGERLAYRPASRRDWVAAGSDAALLPFDATEVGVVRDGVTAVTLPAW